MSEKVEKLLKKPDSPELFNEIDKLCEKTGLHNSDVLNLNFFGYSIKEKK